MKNRIIRFQSFLFALLILLTFSACNRSQNKGLLHIPNDATAVFSLNFQQIQSKLKAADYNTDSLMDVLKTKDSIFLLLKDFDLRQPLLIYIKTSSSMMQGSNFESGAVAALSNRKDLENDLKKIHPDKAIQQGKAISYIQISDNSYCGWNDDLVIALTGRDLTPEALENFFNLKKEASLADNKDAVKLLNTKSDLSFFANSSESLSSIPFLAMSKASDLVKGNYAGGTLNFEQGKAVFEMSNYFNGIVTDLIKKNPTENLSGEGLTKFPGKPLGFVEISFNIKQILSFLEYAGVKNTADAYLKNLGLTLDDVQKAFKGEFCFALAGIKAHDRNLSIGDSGLVTSVKEPNMLITIPLGDKAAYDKVVSALGKMGIFEQQNGQWVPKNYNNSVYKVTDKAVVIATEQSLADAFIAGKGKLEMPDDLDQKNKTAFGYLDIQGLMQQVGSENDKTDSSYQMALKTFKDFTFSADNLKGNAGKMEMVLHLQDPKQSSLVAFLDFVKMADHKKFTDMSQQMPPVVDSAAAPASGMPPMPDASVNDSVE